ncbi:MAG: enoyl-CoA hydratase/isomerase family protein [Haloferacaceae archaeon]
MGVTFDRDERPNVGHLRLDFDDLNRLTTERVATLESAVRDLPDDLSVLTVAGGDADDGVDPDAGLAAGLHVGEARDWSVDEMRTFLETLHDAVEAVRDLNAVTVAACGGYAIGAGLELAMGCDFRVATAEAALGLPEVDVGLPTVLHGALLPLYVGYGTAAEMVFLGDPIPGTRAADEGLVHEAPPADEYRDAVTDLVDGLAEKSPTTLRHQKRVVKTWRSNGLEAAVHNVGAGLAAFATPDRAEAMAAFVEDREPTWES